MAIPLGATAALPVEPAAVGRSAPPATQAASRAPTRTGSRSTSWLGRATVAVALLLVVMVALARLISAPSSATTGPSASASAAPRASASAPAPSPSIAPSPSVAPSPTPDPALARLQALEAAISAARGGPDGLKGKDANDLEKRTADIRKALDAGDRVKALELARKLDKRIADLGKAGATLRDESAALVRALGG